MADTGPNIQVDPSLANEAPLELPVGLVVGGRYKIVRRMGSGGRGAVYEAEDSSIADARVAMKVLHGRSDAEREQLLQEMRALARLQKPEVVKVTGFGTDKLRPGDETSSFQYLVMEYLEGQPLAQVRHARPGGRMTPLEAAKVGRAIALALEVVHDAGFVHRDLKPENVMLELHKTDTHQFLRWLKLIDLGLAINSGQRAVDAQGTPAYVAPEQVKVGEVTPRTDFYALGIILYELITGQLPFNSERMTRQLDMQVNAEMPRARDLVHELPERFDDLIAQLTQKDPKNRPQSAGEVASELRMIEADLMDAQTNVRFNPLMEEPPKSSKRRKKQRAETTAPELAPVSVEVAKSSFDARPTDPARPPVQAQAQVTVPVQRPAPAAKPALPPRMRMAGLESVGATGKPEGSNRLLLFAGAVALLLVAIAAYVALKGKPATIDDPLKVKPIATLKPLEPVTGADCTFTPEFAQQSAQALDELKGRKGASGAAFAAGEQAVRTALEAKDCAGVAAALATLDKATAP